MGCGQCRSGRAQRMRYEREIRARGERLFDRPCLAPGLAELSTREFTSSTCLKPSLIWCSLRRAPPKTSATCNCPAASTSCASCFSAALVFRESPLPLGAGRPRRARQSFRAARTTRRRVGGFPPQGTRKDEARGRGRGGTKPWCATGPLRPRFSPDITSSRWIQRPPTLFRNAVIRCGPIAPKTSC